MALCFIYEFAREHAKDSKRWLELTKQLQTYKPTMHGRKNKSRMELIQEIFSIFGKGNALHFFCDPAFLTTPWQILDKKLRCEEAEQFNQQKSEPQNFRENVCLSIMLERDFHEYARAGVKDFFSWVLLDRSFHDETDQREHGFFALNWNYTNGQLIDEFKRWLDEKRGDNRKAAASRQGESKLRQHLTALGAKRLLDSGFTVVEAMDYTDSKLGNNKGLYGHESQWSRAKTRIVPAALQILFSAEK